MLKPSPIDAGPFEEAGLYPCLSYLIVLTRIVKDCHLSYQHPEKRSDAFATSKPNQDYSSQFFLSRIVQILHAAKVMFATTSRVGSPHLVLRVS